MTYNSIAGYPKVRNAAAILAAAGLIFAVILAAKYGQISAGNELLMRSLFELPHRVVTTSPPSRGG